VVSADHTQIVAPWPTDPLRRAPYVARVGIAVVDEPQIVAVEAVDDRADLATMAIDAL